ncbi:DUF2946 family protein [Caenimonas koreensis]|uniref:DUF2946 family protein n=1 Tax=Caenimonas koreensis TaxID=367474 RepID=UPI003898EB1B
MLRLRVVLAWLLLLALPLQGFAAASMLYCGPAGKAALASVATHAHGEPHAHDGKVAHDHQHDHVSPGSQPHEADQQLPDAGHSCGVCGACSHSVAITETPHLVNPTPVPHVLRSEFFVAFPTRPSPVPDKPPRA